MDPGARDRASKVYSDMDQWLHAAQCSLHLSRGCRARRHSIKSAKPYRQTMDAAMLLWPACVHKAMPGQASSSMVPLSAIPWRCAKCALGDKQDYCGGQLPCKDTSCVFSESSWVALAG